ERDRSGRAGRRAGGDGRLGVVAAGERRPAALPTSRGGRRAGGLRVRLRPAGRPSRRRRPDRRPVLHRVLRPLPRDEGPAGPAPGDPAGAGRRAGRRREPPRRGPRAGRASHADAVLPRPRRTARGPQQRCAAGGRADRPGGRPRGPAGGGVAM
ncbi:MAG: Thioredoxin, partial [uncultured Pseudonocardia sp.]